MTLYQKLKILFMFGMCEPQYKNSTVYMYKM